MVERIPADNHETAIRDAATPYLPYAPGKVDIDAVVAAGSRILTALDDAGTPVERAILDLDEPVHECCEDIGDDALGSVVNNAGITEQVAFLLVTNPGDGEELIRGWLGLTAPRPTV